ncbi:MAG TPA: carboxylesterase/lipase family protein [Dehalococcoidales bacterium]|nr:carboxylesterase/lipase family protein [Dehalococcoidales bacterium]
MSEATEAIVKTTAGKVEGNYRRGAYVFCGIPYAAPPVGGRRWLPPQPVEPWDGVRPVKRFATTAPQNPPESSILAAPQPEPQDEDCLYLNIFTPGLDDARRPVLFWIHGGGFTTGSGSALVYYGRNITMRGDVVLVTINYRLGALGFLKLDEVTNGKIPATGNEGLLDQTFALEWVRDNIDAFGGDPDNVTIFGESAGGMSVGAQLAMPGAKGLFHKAIPQSGAAHTASSLDRSVKAANVFIEILGVSAGDTDALRSLTVDRLMEAQKELAVRSVAPDSGIGGGLPLQPVIDGKVLPELPINAIASGSADGVPVLVGSNLEEWKLFGVMDPSIARLTEEQLPGRCRRLIPSGDVSGLIEAYRKAREKRGVSSTPAELLMAIQTDRTFRMPAIVLAETQMQRGTPAYNYLFTWTSPAMEGRLGACHALELGFLFGTHEENFSGTGPEADALSENMQDTWVAFARTGDPSCESLGKWPAYGERRETMLLGRESALVEAPYEEERRAWDAIPDVSAGTF